MHRINPLPRKVLITTDEVVAMGPTDQTVDPRNLLSAIQIAEDRFIKKSICKGLYYDFREKKNVRVDAINLSMLQELVNEGNNGELIVLKEGQLVNALEQVDYDPYVDLWNEHLWKLLAECVVYIATPTNFMRFTSQGEMQNSPKSITGEGQASATAERKDVMWKMDKLLMDRIDPLIESMHEWICDNRGLFPLYTCKECESCDAESGGVSYKRKTAWVHGIYDNDKEACCG